MNGIQLLIIFCIHLWHQPCKCSLESLWNCSYLKQVCCIILNANLVLPCNLCKSCALFYFAHISSINLQVVIVAQDFQGQDLTINAVIMHSGWFKKFFSSYVHKPAHDGQTKYLGITSPISTLEPKPIDMELTKKLQDTLEPFGVFESEMELNHR